jgi:glycosyltransferase involved in cell wall biosynthesis
MIFKKKIILFSNSSWNLYNFRLPLIKELKKKNFYIIALAPNDKFTNYLKKRVNKFYSLNFLNKRLDIFIFFKNLKKIYKLIKEEKPNYILSYTVKCNVITVIISKLINITSYINITGLGSVFLKKNFYYFFLKRIIIFFYRKHNKIIFQNIDDAKLIHGRNYRKKNFDLISGTGVDVSFFKPYLKKKRNKNINFYMISRIIQDKGVYEYFEAIEKISLKYPEVKFNFVGNFDFENPSSISKKNFFDNIKKLNINYFIFRKNIKVILKKADCIVHPSYREGLSRVLLEAASMQVPIITTKVAGCKEIVKDKYNGFLCKPRCANDLAKSITKFIELSSEEKKKMSINARTLIKDKFDQKIILKKYLELLNE